MPDEKQQEKEESDSVVPENSRLSKRTWRGVLCQRERRSESSPQLSKSMQRRFIGLWECSK
jgi:hypothetical protein